MSLEPCQGMHLLSHCRVLAEVSGEPSSLSPKSAPTTSTVNASVHFIIANISFVEGHFPSGSVVKNLPANVVDVGLIPGPGRFPGEGNGNPI